VTLAAVPQMPVRDAPETALIIYPALLLGGMFSGLMESWLDNVVLVGYPPEQNLPVLQSFGRSVPIFVPIGYGWFCGGLLYLVARAYQRGVTPRRVWQLFGAIALIDFVAIGLSSWIGILQFFGDPPMNIAGYPLWWAGIDGLDVVLGGAMVFVLLHFLHGRSQAWLLLVPSIALGAAAGIVGWPVSTAINSSWSMPAKYACAVASIGLSLACVRFLATAVPRLAHLLDRAPAQAAAPAAAETERVPVLSR